MSYARASSILLLIALTALGQLRQTAPSAAAALQSSPASVATVLPPPPTPGNSLLSLLAPKDWEPNADPESPEWSGVTGVMASKDPFGEPVKLSPTEVRSRWTRRYLYLLFICPYESLSLPPEPVTGKEAEKIWDTDIAEVLIGADYLNHSKYKEFQMSPQGEFLDLDVDREHPDKQKGVEWDSGMTVKARNDAAHNVWYGEMRIPFSAFDKRPKKGDEFRLGLFRVAGVGPKRISISWRATQATTFHIPESFGSLILATEPEKKN